MEYNRSTTVKGFFKRRLLICGIVFAICLVLFLSAMQITSAMILGDEAMSTYINYTLSQDTQNITKETLGLYFSDSIINSGELDKLKSSYDSFSISNFVESNETSWVWAWPWGFSATVKIHVSVKNLQGEYTGDLDDGEAAPEIAAFPNGTYSLRLRKRGGQWHVTDIRCVSQDPVESIAPMPTLKPSPTPVETEPPEDVGPSASQQQDGQ